VRSKVSLVFTRYSTNT